MGARQKLNGAYMMGSILIATFFGCAFGSWGVFFIALLVLLTLNLISGEIRP